MKHNHTKFTILLFGIIAVLWSCSKAEIPDRTNENATETDITAIKINWGWASQWTRGNNDGWYGLAANWYVWNETYYNYNQNVSMIFGFHLSDN